MLYAVIKISCILACWLLLLSVLAVLDGSKVLVERTPCLCPLMCPFGFSRIRGKIGDIIDVDERLGEIISASDGFNLHGLCWKTCCRMKISYGLFNNWEFIHAVYGFWYVFGHECL